MKNQLRNLMIILSCVTLVSCASTKKENNKNFTGWIESDVSKLEVLAGYVKMVFKPKMGSFNFYVVDSNLKEEAVLSSANEFLASAFYLKCGNDIYELNASVGIKSETYKVDNGAVVKYFVPKVANVTIHFDCLKSSVDTDFDMVKISAEIENIGTRQRNMALKCVFDTVLGEKSTSHFYTSSDMPIKTEQIYRTMKNEKWFLSKNDNSAMQILLDGGDITPIETVVLGNKNSIETNSWIPNISSEKTFDNLVSYNDSAVCIIWPEEKNLPGEKINVNFYLAFASDGFMPSGYEYVIAEKKVKEVPVVKEVVVQEVVEEKEKVIPNVKFDVKQLSKEKLSQEYVQQLIERISNLEDSGSDIDREEILMLNAELDAILEVLRQ